jgi:membrane-associated phospholipid phosphatase
VDPRPFVQAPSSPPLFPHAADNGFPSDHGAAGGLLAALVTAHKRAVGAVVAVGAVLIAAARVAAHVHHVQDVVAGLAIGVAAGVLAVWTVNRIVAVRARRARSRVSLTRYV